VESWSADPGIQPGDGSTTPQTWCAGNDPTPSNTLIHQGPGSIETPWFKGYLADLQSRGIF
jgi:hypothetical protein